MPVRSGELQLAISTQRGGTYVPAFFPSVAVTGWENDARDAVCLSVKLERPGSHCQALQDWLKPAVVLLNARIRAAKK